MSLGFSATKVTRYFKNSISLAINLGKTLKMSATITLDLIYSPFYRNKKSAISCKMSISTIKDKLTMIFQLSKLLRRLANKRRSNLFNKTIIGINNTSNYSKNHTHSTPHLSYLSNSK